MRRVKKSVVVVIMMLFSMMLFSMTNVHAANKKLKVNKVYTTTKKIKGKTKKKYLVKVKIPKEIFQSRFQNKRQERRLKLKYIDEKIKSGNCIQQKLLR